MKLMFYLLVVFQLLISKDYTSEKYTLTVATENLKNSKGKVIFLLYNTEGSLPDEKFKWYYKKKSIAINNKNARVEFSNLPKGHYAVTILHDENNNGEIDKKFILPLPKEGVGFSNYEDFGLSNRPNFKDASFNLNKDRIITVKVIYK